MCGICGFISFSGAPGPDFLSRFISGHERLRHRGLDDEGFALIPGAFSPSDREKNSESPRELGLITPYRHCNTHPSLSSMPLIDPSVPAVACLAHTRLSVIDTTVSGHQPMITSGRQTAISYNGEIYNYLEIRADLESLGHRFTTESDTEVALAAYLHWGTDCFSRFNGMWAMAILESDGRLLLCRDRFGIKPLFHTESGGVFSFASEAKVLTLYHDAFEPNPGPCCEFLAYGVQQHGVLSLFGGIEQVEPGTYLEVTGTGRRTVRYWDLASEVRRAYSRTASLDPGTELFRIFSDSVRLRLRSDVSVGSLLSGGIDSSLITGFVTGLFGKTLRDGKFSLHSAVYDDPRFSERDIIAQTAAMHRAKVDYFTPGGAEVRDSFDRAILDFESPVRTLSPIVSWLLYRHIRQNSDTVVLLSGQGSDEVFGGYTDHHYHMLMGLIGDLKFSAAAEEVMAFSRHRGVGPAAQARKLVSSLLESLPMARRVQGDWKRRVLGRHAERPGPQGKSGFDALTGKLVYDVTVSPLREYLHYDDRASMAHTLETRLPFLDFRVVAFGLSMPPGSKIRHGESKAFLRRFARPYLHPAVLAEKRKLGFPSPHGPWVEGFFGEMIGQTMTGELGGLLPFLDPGPGNPRFRSLGKMSEMVSPGMAWRLFSLARWAMVMKDFRKSFVLPPSPGVWAGGV